MQVCTLMMFTEFNLRSQLVDLSVIILMYFNWMEFSAP